MPQIHTCCWERARGECGRTRKAQDTARGGLDTALPHPPCPALHHPAAFAAEAKPFGGQSGNADIGSTSHPAQPFSSPRSLSILGYLVQLELLSHPPTASAAASYQLWVESRLEPSERFLLMLLEEAFGAGRPCAAAPGVEHPRAAVSLCSRSGTRPEPPCVPAVVMVNVQPLFS